MDMWNTLGTVFNPFDGITYAMMAIVIVGAGFMMPNMSAIVTTTVTSLAVFAIAVFSRGILLPGDTREYAQIEWGSLLMLPLHSVLVYGAVFAFAITAVHTLRMVSKR